MRLQRKSNQQIITLDSTSALGHGGEARVYEVPQDNRLVAKVYHKPSVVQAHKLDTILANPPDNPTAEQWHFAIAWPVDLLKTVDGSNTVVGFLMPRVKGMRSLLDFYNPKSRREKSPFFNYRYLHRTAGNLAAAVDALHARGYCIGDVNESNILVSDTALITLVDTDSFQVRDPENGKVYRCSVGKPEFTPPELQGKSFQLVDRAPEHDLFGLAVLIFQLLMEGTHPFSGIFQDPGDPPPYEARIAAGHFTYSKGRRVPYIPTPTAPPFEILHPSLQELLVGCFEDGHNNPSLRPSAQAWQAVLKEAENALVSCSVNNQHRYGKHLNACPWCDRTLALGGRDPFPSLKAVQQGQHLEPIEPQQAPPQVQTDFQLGPTRHTVLTPKILFTIISTKTQLSHFVLGLFVGVSVCGLLAIPIIVKNINLATDSTIYPRTSAIGLPNPTTNSVQGPVGFRSQNNSDYKLGDYEGAIENFSQALRLNPNDAKNYLNRGNVYYEMAQHSANPDEFYKLALEDFNSVLRLNSQEAQAYAMRGTVRYKIAQSSRASNPDYWGSIQDFQKAARLFYEQGDLEHYRQVLGNICLALEKNCDSFLPKPKKK